MLCISCQWHSHGILCPHLCIHVCMQAVQAHTDALSQWLSGQLSSLHHSNGAPLIQLYGRHGQQQQQHQQQGRGAGGANDDAGFSQGGVFNFQVLAADGQPVSFSRTDREATAAGLYLRSGCVCNPGVSACAAVVCNAFWTYCCCLHVQRCAAAGITVRR